MLFSGTPAMSKSSPADGYRMIAQRLQFYYLSIRHLDTNRQLRYAFSVGRFDSVMTKKLPCRRAIVRQTLRRTIFYGYGTNLKNNHEFFESKKDCETT